MHHVYVNFMVLNSKLAYLQYFLTYFQKINVSHNFTQFFTLKLFFQQKNIKKACLLVMFNLKNKVIMKKHLETVYE